MSDILAGTVFEGRTFDVHKFATSPKCRGKWLRDDGAACLWTSFFRAFGYEPEHSQGSTVINFYNPLDRVTMRHPLVILGSDRCFRLLEDLCLAVDILRDAEAYNAAKEVLEACKYTAEEYIVERNDRRAMCRKYLISVILLYDGQDPPRALDLMWRLIERLPKTPLAQDLPAVRKEDVLMPVG